MIGYYAHHHGSGHLTRLQSIAAAMDEPVWGLSSAQVPDGWDSGWTQLARDDDPDPGGLVPFGDPTAHGVLHWVPRGHPGLARRAAEITAWVVEHQPRAVVVDVSVEVALLVRLCGVPTVVVAMPGERCDRAHASPTTPPTRCSHPGRRARTTPAGRPSGPRRRGSSVASPGTTT